jgi:uncharacterized Ntn-hydrolase superfamily protein
MMASETVWPAMLDAYRAAEGSLAWRLLAALDAAEREGGDVRGRQSAAILVVPVAGEPWETTVSLRVEDDPEPLVELRRLLELHAAYELADEADSLSGAGRYEDATRLYRQASELAPDNAELRFWAGLGMAHAGDLEAGSAFVSEAIAAGRGWRKLLERLPAELAPSAQSVLARLGLESEDPGDRS